MNLVTYSTAGAEYLTIEVIMCYRWEKTHGLLIEGGLTYEAITKSVSHAAIAFRLGVVELFEYLEV